MDKTFHIDGDFLQEDAPPKPVGHGFPTNESYAKLKQDNYDYALKLKTLARYPLARGMEWQKTTGIKETEFEVGMCNCAIGQNCPFVAEKWFTTCKVAVPLYMPVAEERTFTLGDIENAYIAAWASTSKEPLSVQLKEYIEAIYNPPTVNQREKHNSTSPINKTK